MTLFNAFILGLVQGLTEFLPVSSSGHLVLVETFMNLPVESLKSFDIAVHFGTLLAIVVYFRKDIMALWKAFLGFMVGKRGIKATPEMRANQNVIGYLIVATLPAIVLTLALEKWMDAHFRNPLSVAICMAGVGVLFFVVEKIAKQIKKRSLALPQALTIGLAQTLALIPGVSRSGITISAGLVQGIEREEAARFSFLLGGVAILAGTLYAILEVLRGKYPLPETGVLIVGIGTSFIFGLGAISFLMQYLKKHTLNIFGIYRVVLGILLIGLILGKGI